MSTQGWIARTDTPIKARSNTRVYKPIGGKYEIDALDHKGVCHSFKVKAYTEYLKVMECGHVLVEIGGRDYSVRRKIPYPYHYLHNGTLYALKLNKHVLTNEFALNYDVFCLDFSSIVIIHFEGDKDKEGSLYVSTKNEWLEGGNVNHSGRELQIFFDVEGSRSIPVSDAKAMMDGNVIDEWVRRCQSARLSKS